jgi:hypothetical protein
MLGVAEQRKIMARIILINSHYENIFKMASEPE